MPSTETSTATALADPATDATVTDPATNASPAVTDRLDARRRGTVPTEGAGQPQRPPQAEAMSVPPQELVIAENVRKTFDIDDHPEMRESIAEFGVDTPLLVQRQPDGALHVINGQIRVLIAREVGIAEVPIWVTDADPTLTDNERRIQTTLRQMNVNDRYIPMTDSDRIGGMKLMLDLGASVTRVARGLQIPRDKVKKAAVIGASATATNLADARSHSLDQLAVIAEYERLGDTDAVAQLTAVRSSDFRFRAARIERSRRHTRARLEASLLYAALGFGVLTDEPGESEGGPVFVAAEQLRTETGEPVSEERIRAEAARWAVWVEVEENADLVDRDTGELVHPDTVDWDTRDDTGAHPRDGLRHADTVTRRDRWIPTYYLPADQLTDSGLVIQLEDTDTTGAVAELDETPAARAERILNEAAAAAGQREVARLERRRVRELNERSLAAADRREEFLGRLLRRQRPPTTAAAFVAESLTRSPDLLKSAGAVQKARQLLGLSGLTDDIAETVASASRERAQVITLGLVLGAYESLVDKSFWRYPGLRLPRYLLFLADAAREITRNGEEPDYTLVDVEQAAAGLVDYRHIDLDD